MLVNNVSFEQPAAEWTEGLTNECRYTHRHSFHYADDCASLVGLIVTWKRMSSNKKETSFWMVQFNSMHQKKVKSNAIILRTV